MGFSKFRKGDDGNRVFWHKYAFWAFLGKPGFNAKTSAKTCFWTFFGDPGTPPRNAGFVHPPDLVPEKERFLAFLKPRPDLSGVYGGVVCDDGFVQLCFSDDVVVYFQQFRQVPQ